MIVDFPNKKFVSFHTIACMASDVLFILSFIIGYSIHLFQYAVFKVRMPQALAFGDGDGEIRTHDPLLARQVLSQLSYVPV